MFLGDFQKAGGTIQQLNRVVDAAKYNIYECLVKLDGNVYKALIQEHSSGMTLLGFKEKDTEKQVLERVNELCDEQVKKQMAKRDRWIMVASLLRSLSTCVMFYYCFAILFGGMEGSSGLVVLRDVLGIIVGYGIRKISSSIQELYANLIPGEVETKRSEIPW